MLSLPKILRFNRLIKDYFNNSQIKVLNSHNRVILMIYNLIYQFKRRIIKKNKLHLNSKKIILRS